MPSKSFFFTFWGFVVGWREMKGKKIYALIGARGGSKGIPKKNIINVGGYPLIAYSIAAAKLSKFIDRVIVSTDSEEIAEVARRFGAETPFIRPKKIAGDKSLDIEFFDHAIRWHDNKEGTPPDYIVHLRPTVPVREVAVLDSAIAEILKDKKATSLRSAHAVTPPAFKMFYLDGDYCSYFGRELFKKGEEFFNYPRQQLPKTYHVNGYVDIIKTSEFLKSGLLYGQKMRAFETKPTPDIDDPEDLEAVAEALKRSEFGALFTYLKGK